MVRGLSRQGASRIAHEGLPIGAILYIDCIQSSELTSVIADYLLKKGHNTLYNLVLDRNVVAYQFDESSTAYQISNLIKRKFPRVDLQVYIAGKI